MSRADSTIAVGRLLAAFRTTMSPESVDVYAESLADIQTDLLAATVKRIIERLTFFPSVAEIRRHAAGLAGQLPATPAEAMALVRQADKSRPMFRSDGSLAAMDKYWDWPEDHDSGTLELVRQTLARVGEPSDDEGRPYFGWETGFQKTYEVEAEAVTLSMLADLSLARLPAHQSRLLSDGGAVSGREVAPAMSLAKRGVA